jgi:nitric oxide reductase NorD protein
MPEAEDVIVDAARHATAYAIDLWRRNCPQAPDTPGVVLRDVRARLELLIEAALGAAIPIRVAVPPPSRSALSRLFERGKRERPREVIPGTDGTAIFLPPRIDIADADHALELYRVLGLHQGARVLRGTARVFPWEESLLVQDLYLVSETAAVDARLSERLPGLRSPLTRLRAALLSSRASVAGAQEPLGSVERAYREFLQSGRLHRAPQPDASLRWARQRAASLAENPAYRGFAADVLLGAILKPDRLPAPGARGMETEHARSDTRSARLGRRPRARRAAEDEDDSETGLWMIQTTQPSEHVEDAMGLQRPIDKQPDQDLGGAAESVSELEELRLVSTPGSSRELFIGDEELPVRAGCETPERSTHAVQALAYPEWDYTSGAYRERAAIVRTLEPHEGPANWVEAVLRRNRPTLAQIRRRFEALRSRRSVQHGEPEGEDIDLEAYVSAYSDRRARLPRPDALYLRHRPARRDFSLLLLIDVSASTESWCGGAHRVIDLEKEALLIVSTALEALRVRFAIQAFSGYGATNVRVRQLKSFEERFGRVVGRRVAALEPDEYTRAGAALRHATATLMHEPAYRRLLLLLSDGKPNDCDRYEGRYGAEDTRQALAEARLQGIAPFCLTVDRAASRYLPLIFGSGNYTIVAHPEHVTRALLEWLRNVTAAIA